jgi:hypothetical protein
MALAVGALLSSALSGCFAAAQPRLRVDPGGFHASVETICLQPLQSELPFQDEKEVRTGIAQMIETELAQAGIAVVHEERTTPIWEESVADHGGLYDRYTGRPQRATLELVRETFRKRLRDQLGCDALLQPSAAFVMATFNDSASWDGASAPVASGYMGTMPAVSLWISILDMEGEEIYFGSGGVQVLGKVTPGFWSAEFEELPAAVVLGFRDRNAQAVEAALSTIVEQSARYGRTPLTLTR